MNQTRRGRLIEAALNTLLGFVVSWLTWPLAAWAADLQYTGGQHWAVVGIFTVVSVARGYVVRRWFNARLHAAAVRLAGGCVMLTLARLGLLILGAPLAFVAAGAAATYGYARGLFTPAEPPAPPPAPPPVPDPPRGPWLQ